MKLGLDGLIKKTLITTTAINMLFAINTYSNNLNNEDSERETKSLEKNNIEHEIKYDNKKIEQKDDLGERKRMRDLLPEILLLEYEAQRIPFSQLVNNTYKHENWDYKIPLKLEKNYS